MIFVIKRVGEFPKAVSIEPWAIAIPLAEFDTLKLVLHGVESGSEVYLEPYIGDRLSLAADGLYRADVFINGIDQKCGFE